MPDKHKMTEEEQNEMVAELKRMEYEPLLPIEKKLIGYSIGLGIVLLFVFIWMSKTFFPATTKLESTNAAVKAAAAAPAPAAAPAGVVPAAPAKKE